jgi:hypothetical protein
VTNPPFTPTLKNQPEKLTKAYKDKAITEEDVTRRPRINYVYLRKHTVSAASMHGA